LIRPAARVRVFAYPQPCDMRKSFNTLAGLVLTMGHNVVDGDAFVFVSRSRKRAKVLWYDGTGLCLLAKRLDTGSFAALWDGLDQEVVTLTSNELSLLLEGCSVVGRMKLSPAAVDVYEAGRVATSSFR
jgi:transposase